MDWGSFVISLISCGFLFTLYETIRYRKENKTLKQSEATNSNTEAQSKQIDLAEKFYDKVLDLTEKSNGTIIGKLEIMETRLDEIDKNVLSVRTKQDLMEEYLNGPFHTWLASKEEQQQNKYSSAQELLHKSNEEKE